MHVLLEFRLVDLEGMRSLLLFENYFTKQRNQFFSVSIIIDKNETILSDGSRAKDELPPVVQEQNKSFPLLLLAPLS